MPLVTILTLAEGLTNVALFLIHCQRINVEVGLCMANELSKNETAVESPSISCLPVISELNAPLVTILALHEELTNVALFLIQCQRINVEVGRNIADELSKSETSLKTLSISGLRESPVIFTQFDSSLLNTMNLQMWHLF